MTVLYNIPHQLLDVEKSILDPTVFVCTGERLSLSYPIAL